MFALFSCFFRFGEINALGYGSCLGWWPLGGMPVLLRFTSTGRGRIKTNTPSFAITSFVVMRAVLAYLSEGATRNA